MVAGRVGAMSGEVEAGMGGMTLVDCRQGRGHVSPGGGRHGRYDIGGLQAGWLGYRGVIEGEWDH